MTALGGLAMTRKNRLQLILDFPFFSTIVSCNLVRLRKTGLGRSHYVRDSAGTFKQERKQDNFYCA